MIHSSPIVLKIFNSFSRLLFIDMSIRSFTHGAFIRVQNRKKQTASHWIRNRIALSTLSLFSRPAIYELSLFSSISHVILILLLNLNSLTIFKYNIINFSKKIPSFQSYTCISLNQNFHCVKLYLYQEKKRRYHNYF